MVPKASATSAASRSQSATLETSAWKGAARPPACAISCATASALVRAVCATTATVAPSAPSRRAMDAPIPREPPVTIATLPSSFMPCLPVCVAIAFPSCTEALGLFVAHGSRSSTGACAGAPHARRAAVAACRASGLDPAIIAP